MSDYSDILFMGAAMVIFSLLTLNTTRSFQVTTDTMVRSDLEYRSVALAQTEVDAIRWAEEDKVDPDHAEYLYEDDPTVKTVTYGDSDQYTQTFTITRSSTQIENSADRNRYKVEILIETDALTPPISTRMEYIKTFAK